MAKIDTSCPQCGASNSRKLSLIHAEGLTTTNETQISVGKFNTIGGQTITTTGTSTGSHQTAASKAAAPPPLPKIETRAKAQKSEIMVASFAISGVLVAAPFIGNVTPLAFVFGVLAPFIGVGIAASIDSKPKDDEVAQWRKLYPAEIAAWEEWNNTFSCGSCEHRFMPLEL